MGSKPKLNPVGGAHMVLSFAAPETDEEVAEAQARGPEGYCLAH